jgi:flagellin-specific chaperone FliS
MNFKNIYYHVLHQSPEQLAYFCYTEGINQCKEEDAVKAGDVIRELINSLNFNNKDTKEYALKIFELLKYCLNNINKNNFKEAADVLIGMRESIFHTDLKEDNNE